MTGNAPQPGETPSQQSRSWAHGDRGTAWWRGDGDPRPEATGTAEGSTARPRRRPTPAAQSATLTPPAHGGAERKYTGEAADAHAAGARDATRHLVDNGRADNSKVDNSKVESGPGDDEQPDTTGPDPGYAPGTAAESAGATQDVAAPAQPPEPGHRPEGVPDIMVLPEPSRNRPTVALDRGPVPGQPAAGRSRLGPAPQKPPSPLLETSPFWLSDAERTVREEAVPQTREKVATRGTQHRRVRAPRRPATGLLGLVALGLIAAFFAWVSAEPFWLAVGHGRNGTATVAGCTGDGVTQRCTGQFTAAGGGYTVAKVTLLGVGPDARSPGAVTPARMVSRDSRQAYVGDAGLLLQLRWVLGFALVLLCGLGITGTTGARRLETAKARRRAVLVSVACPVLLLAGFLAAAY